MPHIALRISDTEESVVRPVVMDVIREVMEITNLTPDTRIIFPGNTEVTYQPNTTISSVNENREKNEFSHEKKVFIEVDEDYDEEGAVTTAVMKPENVPFFIDNDIEVYMKPVYSTIETNITVRYRAKDRVQAMRWRDNVRSKISLGRREMVHQVRYSYLVPKPALVLAKEIHRLRENVVGYGEDFEQYKDKCYSKKKTVVVTLAGTEARDAIAETQRRVMGWFDFTAKPERMERDGNSDTWTISFSYHFRYERPINVIMYYPNVVHNQILKPRFRVKAPTDRDNFHELYHSMSTSGFHYFEPGYQLDKWKATMGVSLPDFDDFVPSQILPNSARVFTGLVLIDTENPELLMDFNDLGDWYIEDDIKEFLSSESSFVTKHYHSVFNLSFYRNRDMFHQDLEMIRLDPDLKVILQEPVSLRNYFHVRLSLNTHLEFLTEDAKNRLRKNSCVFKKIIEALYPGIPIGRLLSRLDTCGPVSKDEFESVIRETTKHPARTDPGNRLGYNTVQGFFIRSRKLVDKEA